MMQPNETQERPMLTVRCGFPQVFEQPKKDTLWGKRPESEVAYSRSDYDGRKWWTKWMECQLEKPAADLQQEIDRFQNAIFSMPEFESLDTMRQLCGSAQKTSDPSEFNLFGETEHFHVWLRLITRQQDYNLYVHFYRKQM